MAIILRSTKGSALTHSELDANFTTLAALNHLDSAAVLALAGGLDDAQTTLDSAAVLALAGGLDTAQNALDEAAAILLIDSDYVQARQSSVAAGGIDSAATVSLIDSDYVQARQSAFPAQNISALADVNLTGLQDNHVLKYDSATNTWMPAVDLTGAGGTGIALTDLSVAVNAAGSANLSYNDGTGAFTYTPPDLSTYLTSYTETDTLQSVVDRGATVTTAATFSGGITTTGITTTGAGTPGLTSASAVTITAVDAINIEPGTNEVVKMGGNVDLGTDGATIQHKFSLTASGTTDYIFNDAGSNWFPSAENDPVLYLRRGETYVFQNNSGGSHPFQIRLSNGGAAYNTGVTNNGAAVGLITFTVPMSAPTTLYYQCTNHASMGNTINIV
jgi:hypothetical protein